MKTWLKETCRCKKCHLLKWFLLAPLCQDLWCPRRVQTDPDPTSAAKEGLDKTGTHGLCLLALRLHWRTLHYVFPPGLLPPLFQGIPAPCSGFFSIYSPKIITVLHLRALSSPLYSAQPPIQRHCKKIHNLNIYKWFLKKYTLIFSLKRYILRKEKCTGTLNRVTKVFPSRNSQASCF